MDGFNKMKQNLKKFFAIPTWLYTSLLVPMLPSDHPWKKGFSLKKWESGQTKLCKMFDFIFWIGIFDFFYLVFCFFN